MAGEYAYTNGTPKTSHCNLAEFKILCGLLKCLLNVKILREFGEEKACWVHKGGKL